MEICRTCLRSPDYLINLYQDKELISKIETIASIKVVQDPFFPSKICIECANNINSYFKFSKTIKKNFKDLNDRYETHQKIKAREKEVKNDEDMPDIVKIEIEEDTDSIIQEEDDGLSEKAVVRQKTLHCDDCNKNFKTKRELTVHLRAHTKKGICNICGLVVRSDNLKRHIKLHSEEPIKCDICLKVFKNNESLRSHKRLHLGIIFTCEICGRSYKVKNEYSRHIKIHTNPEINKTVCSICGKKVRDIKKHILSHTGERPHKCDVCLKGFTSPYALKIHRRQHTNEKPFICEYCPMAFPQKVSLVTHLKSKHCIGVD